MLELADRALVSFHANSTERTTEHSGGQSGFTASPLRGGDASAISQIY